MIKYMGAKIPQEMSERGLRGFKGGQRKILILS
jgi:hypothetical protein